MQFHHAPAIWTAHPELAAGVLHADGLHDRANVDAAVGRYTRQALARLTVPESELPEIQAWRRTFARMGLKPTQYRCASESLLRRLRKEGELPRIHPLIDLCNAVSTAFAIPIAVFDLANVQGNLEVRPATGAERYVAFNGEVEQPDPGEVVFADDGGQAHARRWTHRQSAASAIRPETRRVLVVAEAMHATAREDVQRLLDTLAAELQAGWGAACTARMLSADAPAFAA
ncbi:MAG: phenylalanine--tRNA ligase beta subunit-related protein [Pseudomonadota bacterium]